MVTGRSLRTPADMFLIWASSTSSGWPGYPRVSSITTTDGEATDSARQARVGLILEPLPLELQFVGFFAGRFQGAASQFVASATEVSVASHDVANSMCVQMPAVVPCIPCSGGKRSPYRSS